MAKRKWTTSDRPFDSERLRSGSCSARVIPDKTPGNAGTTRWDVYRDHVRYDGVSAPTPIAGGNTKLRGSAKRAAEKALAQCERAPAALSGASKPGWQVALYEHLPSGKAGRHTFDILGPFTRKIDATTEKRNRRGDRRYVPVVERERSRA